MKMEDMKTLFNFGIEHPARTTPFGELKRGLFAEVAKDNINVSYHPEFPELALFKYSLNCVFEQNWNAMQGPTNVPISQFIIKLSRYIQGIRIDGNYRV